MMCSFGRFNVSIVQNFKNKDVEKQRSNIEDYMTTSHDDIITTEVIWKLGRARQYHIILGEGLIRSNQVI